MLAREVEGVMRVAVVGAGGLGGMFGGLHARAGHDVVFVARGANLKALNTDGLTVRLHDEEFHCTVRATEEPSEVGTVDLVWFCVKTYDAQHAAIQMLPLIGPETMVLPVQNGVGTAEMLESELGVGHVLGAVNLGGATLVSPGVVAAKGLRREVAIGELHGGRSTRLEELSEVLASSGIDVQIKEDIQSEIWDKWVVACVTLGLCALFRQPLEPIFANSESSLLAAGVMSEAVAVAAARGIWLPHGTVDRWMQYVRERIAATPGLAGSMYYDILHGRRLELDAMNGAAVRYGRELGVPTPLNFVIYAALLPYANGAAVTG
jgi:2-dehydropantoate 2-reductase